MGLLDDVGNVITQRINRGNPDASLFRAPLDRKEDWLFGSINQFERAAQERREAEERQRKLDEERKKREEERRAAEEKRRQAELEFRQRDIAEYNKYAKAEDEKNPMLRWGLSPEGQRFLTAGGAGKFNERKFREDPEDYVVKNAAFREWIPKGQQGWDTAAAELAKRGVPEDVLGRVFERVNKKPEGVKPIGLRDYGGIPSTLFNKYALETGLGLSEKRATQVGAFAQPFIDYATFGADVGSRPGADKWDLAESLTNRLAFKTIGSTGKGLFQKAATGAAINTATDAPVTYAQLRSAGYSNEEALKVMRDPSLMNPLLIAAAAGGGFGAVSAAPRRLKGEAFQAGAGGAAAYTGSKLTGQDDETARRNALLGAGAPFALRAASKIGTKAGEARRISEQELGPGEVIVYHGTNGPLDGPLRKDAFVTPDRAAAESFARTQSRLEGGEPTVLAFVAKEGSLKAPAEEDFVAVRAQAKLVADPEGLRAWEPRAVDPDEIAFGRRTEEVPEMPGREDIARTVSGKPRELPRVEGGAYQLPIHDIPEAMRRLDEVRDEILEGFKEGKDAFQMQDLMEEEAGLYRGIERIQHAPLVEGGRRGINPFLETGATSAAAGAYGYATGDEEKALQYAAAAAAGRALTGGLSRINPARMGVVDPEQEAKAAAAVAKYYPPDKSLNPKQEMNDKMALLRRKKLEKFEAQQQASRSPKEQVAEVTAEADDFLAHAEIAIEDKRVVQELIHRIGGGKAVEAVNKILDPAGNFRTPHAKKVLAITSAAANYMRNKAAPQQKIVDDTWALLRPLLGGEPHLRRAAAQVGVGAGLGGVTYAAGELTGSEDLKALAPLTAIAAVAGVSRFQRGTKYASGQWEGIALKTPENAEYIHPKLQDGVGKLYHILQRPEMYDLSPEQLTAVEVFRGSMDAITLKTNAWREAAGMDLIPLRPDHGGIMQWFTPASIKKVLGPERAKTFNMETPGFDRSFGPDLERELGPSFDEALAKHDGLELINDPTHILKLQVKMHDQYRAQALMVRQLKEAGDDFVMRVPTESEYAALGDAKTAVKAEEGLRREMGWQQLPGIDDHIFAPEVTSAVADLLVPSRGVDTGPLAVADWGTNLLRGLMFTGDASAWTMQGAMLALNDPVGTIKNAPHLVGASLMGKKYFDRWLADPKNREIWDGYTKSGGIPGLEHEGLEHRTFSVRDIPGLDKLEERGFESFLPIHRALMWKNLQDQNHFINAIGGKLDPLGSKRALSELLREGPAVAGVAYAVGEDDDLTDWDSSMALALGLSTNVVTRVAANKIAKLAPDDIQTRVQSAKQVNRTSGALNRQQMGITAKQAQWERTLAFRSPALARNTVILAKKAITDFGPEGAMARFYLVKTGVLLGTGLAFAQYAATGEWPSFDPTDPESIFNPLNRNNNFLRADLGGLGKLSLSNPVVSLVRALVTTNRPDDVREWRMKDWEPLTGLANWYGSRQPDIIGPLTRLGDGELNAPLPLAVREWYETGLSKGAPFEEQTSGVNDALNLEANKDFTSWREKALAVGAAAFGINASPETRGQELKRLKNEAALRQNPDLKDRSGDGVIDANDLNQAELDKVRAELEENKQYQKVKETFDDEEEEAKEAGENPGPVQAFLDRREGEQNEFETKMRDLDKLYVSKKISAFEAKAVYQYLQKQHRTKQAEIEESLGGQWAGRKGTKETVKEYLNRYGKPEDAAVEKWYDLFEKATKLDGSLDFNKLEKLRAQHMNGLDDATRRYVSERIASFDKPEDTRFGRDYEAAKAVTKPYWDIRSRTWNEMGGSGLFGQFKSYGDFEAAIEQEASSRGMEANDLYDMLERSDPMFKLYNKLVSLEQMLFRLNHPSAETALLDFYQRAPVKGTQAWADKKVSGLGLFQR